MSTRKPGNDQSDVLRYSLFGGVRVVGRENTQIHVAGKQQQLLALLMIAANRTIAADVLVDYLWREDLPANPVNSLQDVVKRLRATLGDSSHRIIVTDNGDYRLVVDPDFLDLALFRRLANAGLALLRAEPDLCRLLLTQALDHAVGDLPDVPPGSRASDDIHHLYKLRDQAAQALELVRSGDSRGRAVVEEEFLLSSPQGQPVGFALRLAELGELALADLVGMVTGSQGRVRRLSQGLLLASFPSGGGALRSAAEIADRFGSEPHVLLGGGVSHISSGGSVRATEERLLRLAGRAEGGQILVSRSVHESATTAHLQELLQSVDDELWQIGHGPVAGRAGSSPRSDVPMVGRDESLVVIGELTRRHRLVTLRGPGGIGKTRIAREMAGILADRFADGVSIVDLAEADRHGDPISLVVRTLALVPEPYRRPLDTLVDRLAGSERLLILDNCEEFIEEVRSLSEALTDECPGVTLLATSRSALGARREAVYDVGELDVTDAAQLLVSLAFPQDGPAPPVAFDSRVMKLCSLLDSVPLAIECAASMVRAMGLDETTTALGSLPDGAVLPVLDAAHGGLGRHRSIELALNLSCRILQESDVRLFERLSSLRGGFSDEDAAGVASESPSDDIGAGLSRLREASLIKRLSSDRWRMLEPVRQFAATRLLRRGEQSAQAARHARHFVALAEQAEVNLRGADEARWFRRLTDAYPNLGKALSWTVEAGDTCAALRLTSSLWWYWAAQGKFVEGAEAVERALAVEGPAPNALRAKALVATSHLSWWAGNPHRTETSLTEAMRLITPREPGNTELISLEAWARTGLAASRMWGGGDYDALVAHLEEGLRLFSSIGDLMGVGLVLATHGGAAWHYGDDELHLSKSRDSLRAFEEAGHLTMVAQMKRIVGLAKAGLGDVDAGRVLLNEGLRLSEELGDVGGLSHGLCFLGLLEVWGGDRRSAAAAFRQSIIINRTLGQVWPSLLAIGIASEEACLKGRQLDGIMLHSVVGSLTNRTGIRLPPRDGLRIQSIVERATHLVGEDDVLKAREAGYVMELPRAALLALAVLEDGTALG